MWCMAKFTISRDPVAVTKPTAILQAETRISRKRILYPAT